MNNYYFSGPVLGTVTDNQDPDNLARVKVMVFILGNSVITDWIPVMSLYASSDCGAFFLPEVNDQVVVAFLGDNPDSGVVLGSIWNIALLPPSTGENFQADFNMNGENSLHFIKSRSGHMIIMDDSSGAEKLQIISADGGTRFEFLAKSKKLSLKTDKGFVLSAKGGMSIKAKECKFKIDKGLKIEANGIVMESTGKDLKIKASSAVSLEGGQIKLN